MNIGTFARRFNNRGGEPEVGVTVACVGPGGQMVWRWTAPAVLEP